MHFPCKQQGIQCLTYILRAALQCQKAYMHFWREWHRVFYRPISSQNCCCCNGRRLLKSTNTQTRLLHELPLVACGEAHWDLLNQGLLEIVLAPLQEPLCSIGKFSDLKSTASRSSDLLGLCYWQAGPCLQACPRNSAERQQPVGLETQLCLSSTTRRFGSRSHLDTNLQAWPSTSQPEMVHMP